MGRLGIDGGDSGIDKSFPLLFGVEVRPVEVLVGDTVPVLNILISMVGAAVALRRCVLTGVSSFDGKLTTAIKQQIATNTALYVIIDFTSSIIW
jgi:hypothetical protein